MTTNYTVEHKRGATLSYSGAITVTETGVPVDLTGYTLTSEVRNAARTLIVAATVVVTDAAAGEFTVTVASADTEDWVPGAPLFFDVRLESASRVDATATVRIDVVEWVTQP